MTLLDRASWTEIASRSPTARDAIVDRWVDRAGEQKRRFREKDQVTSNTFVEPTKLRALSARMP